MTQAQRQAQEDRDIAHHKERVEWLSADSPKWVDGTPVSRSDVFKMLADSKAILLNPMIGFNTGPQA